MFCTYTAFTILIGTLVQLDRVKPAILFSLLSASLKLIVAIILVGGKSNFPDPTPAFAANIVADGAGAIGALFALGMAVGRAAAPRVPRHAAKAARLRRAR